MTFYAFGLNHETASVAVREAFSFSEDAARAFYRDVRLSEEGECILLSTCNRTEVYLFGTEEDLRRVREHIRTRAEGTSWRDEDAFLYADEAAIRHVLEVACGLRSMVLGDGQILNQVKEAYRLAVEEDGVESVLHRLMHTAFRTAKRVINETGLSDGLVSVASAAVKTARQHFEEGLGMGFKEQRVLVVGAGEMARLTVEALRSHGLRDISLTNRSRARGLEVAGRIEGAFVEWKERHEAVKAADLVIVATGAQEPVLRAERLPAAAERPATLLLDIALPRNVDPAADKLAGYKVVDLDRIDRRLEVAEARRRESIPDAKALCEKAVHEFVTWIFHQQAMQPAIHAIRDTFEMIRRQEIERHHHRFSELDRKELDRITRSILQKLLAVPVVRLKSVDPESIDYVRGIRLLYGLFSHPACEDLSADDAAEHPEAASPSAACPFETYDEASETSPLEMLRAALRGDLLPEWTEEETSPDIELGS